MGLSVTKVVFNSQIFFAPEFGLHPVNFPRSFQQLKASKVKVAVTVDPTGEVAPVERVGMPDEQYLQIQSKAIHHQR